MLWVELCEHTWSFNHTPSWKVIKSLPHRKNLEPPCWPWNCLRETELRHKVYHPMSWGSHLTVTLEPPNLSHHQKLEILKLFKAKNTLIQHSLVLQKNWNCTCRRVIHQNVYFLILFASSKYFLRCLACTKWVQFGMESLYHIAKSWVWS